MPYYFENPTPPTTRSRGPINEDKHNNYSQNNPVPTRDSNTPTPTPNKPTPKK